MIYTNKDVDCAISQTQNNKCVVYWPELVWAAAGLTGIGNVLSKLGEDDDESGSVGVGYGA